MPTKQPEHIENGQTSIEDSPSNDQSPARRKSRPFAAGLAIILSGLFMLVPAFLSFTVADIEVQVSAVSSIVTALLAVMLVICGFATWLRPESRIYTGIAAMVLGIIALPAANFGGFIIGTLLALIGGVMALSWDPELRFGGEARK